MTHPKPLSKCVAAFGAVLALSTPYAFGQEADEAPVADGAEPTAADRAQIVAANLVEGLPCTTGETSTALERRLTESMAPLVDLAAGLDLAAASEDNCEEIRAAAARQRLYIVEDALNRGGASATPASGSTLMLAFEVGPPPKNMLRQRSTSR